jgi:1,2-diacylglycerol 3-alpha-glucosyltransferase
METLKIAFYTDSYLPAVDGVVTSILNTRAELEKRGHEVSIFAPGGKNTAVFAKKDKNLFVIKGIKFNKYPQYTIGILARENSNVFGIKPDVIHAHTPFSAGILAYKSSLALNTSFISTFHTMAFSDEVITSYLTNNKTVVKVSKYIVLKYLKWFYSKTDSVIAPTIYTKKFLKNNGIKKVTVIPTGIDFSSMKKVNKNIARKILNIKPNDKIILYFGRVSKEKNVELLLKAAKPLAMHGFKILIAGAGPFLEELSELNKKMGNKNVKFTGFVKDTDISYYYSSADLLCNPSLFETQSIVDLYAAFYDLPILVPKRTAQEELLGYSRCGEVFDSNSIRDLVEKANRAYERNKRYNFNKIIKEFDIKITVDKLLSLYNRI